MPWANGARTVPVLRFPGVYGAELVTELPNIKDLYAIFEGPAYTNGAPCVTRKIRAI